MRDAIRARLKIFRVRGPGDDGSNQQADSHQRRLSREIPPLPFAFPALCIAYLDLECCIWKWKKLPPANEPAGDRGHARGNAWARERAAERSGTWGRGWNKEARAQRTVDGWGGRVNSGARARAWWPPRFWWTSRHVSGTL